MRLIISYFDVWILSQVIMENATDADVATIRKARDGSPGTALLIRGRSTPDGLDHEHLIRVSDITSVRESRDGADLCG